LFAISSAVAPNFSTIGKTSASSPGAFGSFSTFSFATLSFLTFGSVDFVSTGSGLVSTKPSFFHQRFKVESVTNTSSPFS
jgi:hypothetical protein